MHRRHLGPDSHGRSGVCEYSVSTPLGWGSRANFFLLLSEEPSSEGRREERTPSDWHPAVSAPIALPSSPASAPVKCRSRTGSAGLSCRPSHTDPHNPHKHHPWTRVQRNQVPDMLAVFQWSTPRRRQCQEESPGCHQIHMRHYMLQV